MADYMTNSTGTFSSISGSPTPTTSRETRPRIWPNWPGSSPGPVSEAKLDRKNRINLLCHFYLFITYLFIIINTH